MFIQVARIQLVERATDESRSSSRQPLTVSEAEPSSVPKQFAFGLVVQKPDRVSVLGMPLSTIPHEAIPLLFAPSYVITT